MITPHGLRRIGSCAFALGCTVGVFAADPAAPAVAPTAWQVYQIFHASCAGCHGGHLAKPKGKLGYILDLPLLVEKGHVLPGDPEGSDLLKALVSTDDEEKMPPPDSDGPMPSADDIELVRVWIAAGAAATTDAPVTASATPLEKEKPSRPVGQRLGRLHPLLVHFPIALLLGASVAELFSRRWPRHASWLQGMTRGSLWLATVGGMVAAACGWLNAAHEGYASGEVDTHRWLGVATAALAVIALIASELAERARARDATYSSRGVLLLVLVIAAVVVTFAGHTGGVLAYGKDYFGF